MKLRKILYIIGGIICVVLGSAGVVVPGLPTTPFILLASWLFYRSSERLQQWLLRSYFGKYIREYERNKGMTVKGKVVAISLMAVMCTISSVFLIHTLWVSILVGALGLIGSLTVAFWVPTAKPRNYDTNQ